MTGMALFDFDPARARFSLVSAHPGFTLDDVIKNTGFTFDAKKTVPTTPPPDAPILALIRGRIRDEIAETYPRFAARAFVTPGAC